eukprot:Gregarina_sp_Pseudo_9__4766@NODE_497_length_2707_cov_134_778486_g469_i0_p2_GENE_NODE_497_length_2707_cov_134_778486_g469_i0NODE_497_length_2707_cov_134_778486_g469_i0_p2_ORF_typecomplete_len284_score46_32Integrin_beta/PF00362_18/0_00012Herpes_ICP4_C/PF03585_14/9_9Herpes_ICP4_C/PF03585_14/7_4IFT43/PF15305_6/0_16_NODE_497_length_2707_cov_134_778486_g469_i017642615
MRICFPLLLAPAAVGGRLLGSDVGGLLSKWRGAPSVVNCTAVDVMILHEASRQAATYKGQMEASLAPALEVHFKEVPDVHFYLSTFQDKFNRNSTRHCYKERVKAVHHVLPIADGISYLPHLADLRNGTANTLEGIANAIQRGRASPENWGHGSDRRRLIIVTAVSAPKTPRDENGRLRRRHKRWPREISTSDMESLCGKHDYPSVPAIAKLVEASHTYVGFLILPSTHQVATTDAYHTIAAAFHQAPESVQQLDNVDNQNSWNRALSNIMNSYNNQVCQRHA